MDLNLGQIGQIAFSVSDVDQAEDFYETKLGLTKLFRPHETMVFFDCGGVNLYLQKAQKPEDVAGGAVLYFNCDDLALAVRELTARGVDFITPPHRVAEQPTYDLWMAFFKDPDGHILALQMQAPKGYVLP